MKLVCLRLFAVSFLLFSSSQLLAQQHSYAPSDIENGRGLYQANCLGCHGDNGMAVEGVNLPSGKYRRAGTDEEIIALIRNGIPNTLMIPKPQFDYGELRALVAYLRSMSTTPFSDEDERDVTLGDLKRGEELFFGKANCNACHGINGSNSPLYQDLAGIGAQRSPANLEDSILEPNKEVREGERFYQVTDHQGNSTAGKLLNQDRYSIQLLNMDEKLESFLTKDLSEKGFISTPMPSYLDVLSAREISDLVAYLVSLKE